MSKDFIIGLLLGLYIMEGSGKTKRKKNVKRIKKGIKTQSSHNLTKSQSEVLNGK